MLLFALAIGFVAGLRTMMAPAAVAWAVRLGWLNLQGSPFAFMESNLALAGFSIAALGELVVDLLPSTPKRTAAMPLIARICSGGFCGACLFASAHQSLMIGTALGAAGAIVGAFAGYEIRKRLVRALNIRDVFIALVEDAVAIGMAAFLVSR